MDAVLLYKISHTTSYTSIINSDDALYTLYLVDVNQPWRNVLQVNGTAYDITGKSNWTDKISDAAREMLDAYLRR